MSISSSKISIDLWDKPYNKVEDIGLAGIGRKEVENAEREMPGLMSLRESYVNEKPLSGVRITASLHVTIQAAVLIETLIALGAEVRAAACNIFSTQAHAAAAIAESGVPVFAWHGETMRDYWISLFHALNFGDGKGPNLVIDDSGDAALMLHQGFKLESNTAGFDNEETNDENEAILKDVLKEVHSRHPQYWHNMVKEWYGISEATASGVNTTIKLFDKKELLVPTINVNDSVTKSKFDNIYGCRESLPDAIKRATDTMIAGKLVVISGYGDVGKGCADSMSGFGARVVVTEVDPICAMQAAMAGFEVVTIEDTLGQADIYVTATGNTDVITVQHMEKMKDHALVCNIGNSVSEIQFEKLNKYPNIQKVNIKPQVDKFIFPDGHAIILLAEGRLVNLACANGHPSFVMSNSFSNQILAQLELHKNRNKYNVGIHHLPKSLDEQVARLHLNHLGVKLTKLSDKQSKYLGVSVDGPYKADYYKY